MFVMIRFKLDELLRELNYSRNRFSQITKIRPNTINDMCNGHTKRIELETLTSIMKALNEISDKPLTLCDLMEYTDNK